LQPPTASTPPSSTGTAIGTTGTTAIGTGIRPSQGHRIQIPLFPHVIFGRCAVWMKAAWIAGVNVTGLPFGWPFLLDLLAPGIKVRSMAAGELRSGDQGEN